MDIYKVINFPRNIYLNVRIFGFLDGTKMPLYFTHNVKIGTIRRGCVDILGKKTRFMIEIGAGGSKGIPAQDGYFSIKKNAKAVFHGSAFFAEGCVIRLDGGETHFGQSFNANKNNVFWSSHGMAFGDDVLLGYHNYFRDDDGHVIIDKNGKSNMSSSIIVGNHVWITSNVSILKGVNIPDECVIGYNSCVTKSFNVSNCLIAGYPAKICKQDISWNK